MSEQKITDERPAMTRQSVPEDQSALARIGAIAVRLVVVAKAYQDLVAGVSLTKDRVLDMNHCTELWKEVIEARRNLESQVGKACGISVERVL